MTAAFSGELGLIGLFDLGQLLMLNGATGVLAITAPEGHKGFLYFESGQIVNALDETHQDGELAAFRLFGWKQGHFEFRPEPPGGVHRIQDSTEGLMMEAARRMDEAGLTEGGEGETARLREKQSQFEALREAFQTVARDARFATDEGAVQAPGGVPLATLRDPADRLLYRVGEPPRLMQNGRWRTLGDEPLDAASYDQIKARLFDNARPGAPGGPNAMWRLIRDEQGDAYAASLMTARREPGGEALWIRPAHIDPNPSLLSGPVERLHELLDQPSGLLVVSAPTSESCDRTFHAVVALLAQRRGQAMLLVAEGDAWRHRDGSGVLVRCSADAASATLRAMQPEVAAFDAAHDTVATDALHVASLVVVAQVAPTPAAAVPRWLARHGLTVGALGELLAGTPVSLVCALPAQTGGRVPFEVMSLTAPPAAPAETAAPPATAPAATPERASTGRAARAKPAAEPAAPGTPAPASGAPKDPMRALAEELGRQLRKSA